MASLQSSLFISRPQQHLKLNNNNLGLLSSSLRRPRNFGIRNSINIISPVFININNNKNVSLISKIENTDSKSCPIKPDRNGDNFPPPNGGGGGDGGGHGGEDDYEEKKFGAPMKEKKVAVAVVVAVVMLYLMGSRRALRLLTTSCAMLLDKMLPNLQSLSEAGIKIVIHSCCATFAEIQKRGKDLWDEFKSYVADLLAGMLAPYARTGNRSVAIGLNNSFAALPSSLDKGIAPAVMATRQGKNQKKLQAAQWKGKGKGKLAYAPNKKKNKIPPPAEKEHLAKDQACHHCGVIGHWKRNCPAYVAELKKGKFGSSNPGT